MKPASSVAIQVILGYCGLIDRYFLSMLIGVKNLLRQHCGAFLFAFYLSCPFLKKDLCSAGSCTINDVVQLYKALLHINSVDADIFSKLIREYE